MKGAIEYVDSLVGWLAIAAAAVGAAYTIVWMIP